MSSGCLATIVTNNNIIDRPTSYLKPGFLALINGYSSTQVPEPICTCLSPAQCRWTLSWSLSHKGHVGMLF